MSHFRLFGLLLLSVWFSLSLYDPFIGPKPVQAAEESSGGLPQASPAVREQAEKELASLRAEPEKFRTLVTGVQIFLGRFGYGVGPYTGKLDQPTEAALKAYQQHVGLDPTGEINFLTLKHLTEDDRVLNRIVPLLPRRVVRDQDWEKWIELQGSWMLKEGNTDDVLQTSQITCMREFKRCIDSTASLVNASVPQFKVHTHVYDIKEWDDAKIVSNPYDGEACAISVLRISRKPPLVTRFVSMQGKTGPCAKVKAEDRQYFLEDGEKIYQILKGQKASAIQQILRVAQ